jgi:hypothetical protein
MTMLQRILHTGVAVTLAAIGLHAAAKDDPIYTGTFSRTAVGGYDTVAYFTQQQPVKGVRLFCVKWMGAEWRFASAANRERFVAAPEQYAPQYGGYCAWAVSQGYTASGDPRYWKLVDGKLYLNYDADVQKKWEQDIHGFIAKADRQWPAVLEK